MATTTNVIKGGLAINEVGADPTGTPGFDTDNDGTTSLSSDEFVEIVNVSGDTIDLTGVQLWDGDGLIHTLSGSLPAGGTLLILDENADLASAAAAYPDATVVLASGSMALNNTGESLGLVDTSSANNDFVVFNYGDGATADPVTDNVSFPGSNLIGTDTTTSTGDGQSVQRSPGGDDNTIVADASPGVFCFARGTLIATPTGQKRVEDLRIDDAVQTQGGHAVPIKWIGRQTVSRINHSVHMQPVRITAGALGKNIPDRDLTVTADHGMVLDGIVINAACLINRATIDWVPMADLEDSFIIYHVETEDHDVIFADNAPAETFVDYASRRGFDNVDEYLALYGSERIIPDMLTPRVTSARLLPAAIKDRLGISDTAEPLRVA
ncbi:MAG: Hint domain-containing protein [Pseudomonadota bacterium]